MNQTMKKPTVQGAKALAVVIGVLGLLLILVPLLIFPVCSPSSAFSGSSAAGIVHPCHNTLYAESLMGIFTIITGFVAFFRPDRQMISNVSLWILVLAIIVVVLPLGVTGVCTMPNMSCRNGTVPGLVTVGVLMVFSGLWGMLLVKRAPKSSARKPIGLRDTPQSSSRR
jgi:hypothetical protein